ncbi:MAG: 2-dehydropantoate 2-reductase [Pseudomonadota bacterium]
MRFVILGAGAIGATLGARLFEAGEDVVLIARGRHGERLRRSGLTFISARGRRVLPIPTVKHPAALRFRDDDIVLLCVKSQHTEAALADLRTTAGDEIPIVCAQNGVANERMALRRFAQVYAMLVMLPATFLNPAEVVSFAEGAGGVLDCGRFPGSVDERAQDLCDRLRRSGFAATPRPDVMRYKYAKLLTNLGNAVQALCGRLTESDHATFGRMLTNEALACFSAAAIPCASEPEFRAARAALRLHRIDGYARSGGSSWQSVARGAGDIESDYLNGEIVRLGRLHGVPTPANLVLQREAAALIAAGRSAGSLSVAALRDQLRAEGVALS